jgi:tRNA(Glu) U13 pseudouridine synthase TruD
MAKYLILLTKEDKNTVEMALEFSKVLKMMKQKI